MLLPENPHLRQFLLFVFALIIPCFALWTVAAGALAMPVIGLANMVLQGWFPMVVDSLSIQGGDIVLLTQFGDLDGRPVPMAQSEYQLGFQINPQILSYSIPFYAALHFATQKEGQFGSFMVGLLWLYPFILLGLIVLCMKEMMVLLGPMFLEQPGVWVPHANVIGLVYQLSVLIFPTVMPIAIWALQSQHSALFRSVLGEVALPE